MKKNLQIGFVLFLCFFSSCKSVDTVNNAKEEAQFEQLVQWVKQQSYQININAIYPFNSNATTQVINALLLPTGNSAARIDVTGEGNYIKVFNNKVKANLAYFGERRIGGNYGGTNSGIVFDEKTPEDYQIEINDKKKYVTVKFSANNVTENYSVTLRLFLNNNAYISINSSHLNQISYDGSIVNISEELIN